MHFKQDVSNKYPLAIYKTTAVGLYCCQRLYSLIGHTNNKPKMNEKEIYNFRFFFTQNHPLSCSAGFQS